ncbi:hypothetical protein Tco_0779521 [Tanacetum coccineum]
MLLHKQFWATVKMKTIIREVQLQALVDGKKIIITEATVRRDLQLKDAEGIDYLPNADIFEQLTLMGSRDYKFETESQEVREERRVKNSHKLELIQGITLDSTYFDADTDMFGVHDLDGDEVLNLMRKAEPLLREKDEANVALIEEWNDIQAKNNADYQMAKQMQAEEQEELSIEEKSKLFVQLLKARKKHFATERGEEKRNRQPARAQQRSIVYTYLKNMAGWKPKDLKSKSPMASILRIVRSKLSEVNTFVDFRTELVKGTKMEESSKKTKVMEESSKKVEIAQESSSKRAGDELEEENAKKHKVDDQEAAKMKELMKIVPDEEEVAVDAIPLATKPLSIVD